MRVLTTFNGSMGRLVFSTLGACISGTLLAVEIVVSP
jgi:hypothetical protein